MRRIFVSACIGFGALIVGVPATEAQQPVPRWTTTCQFTTGPRAGTTVTFQSPPATPARVGAACGDGTSSFGIAVDPTPPTAPAPPPPAGPSVGSGVAAGSGAGAGATADGASTRHVLQIAPVMQSLPVWCWLAVGEMAFRHFGVPQVQGPNYQCGIIGAISIATNYAQCASPTSCALCAIPAGSTRDMIGMLADYPRRAARISGSPAPRLYATVAAPLSDSEMQAEIDASRPVVVGISPSRAGLPAEFAAAQHVALVVGYEFPQQGPARFIINDPYPYPAPANPYLAAGGQPSGIALQYVIASSALRSQLGWSDSFLLSANGRHSSAGATIGSSALPPAVASRCVINQTTGCPLAMPMAPAQPCMCPSVPAWGISVP
jgi:hypothetical protein